MNGYFALYEKYLKKSEEAINWRSKTRALVLVLRNDGGISAADIQITLKFPKGISIVADEHYKKDPPMPLPPTFDSRTPSQLEKEDNYFEQDSDPREIKVANIRNFPDGSEVILTAKGLRHTCEDSAALNVHFRDKADVHPFQLRYEIWISNFPKLITGTLNVVVNLGKESTTEDDGS